jgi:hypothetical protein
MTADDLPGCFVPYDIPEQANGEDQADMEGYNRALRITEAADLWRENQRLRGQLQLATKGYRSMEAKVEMLEGEDVVHIVFDGPPSHESGRFVECETAAGVGINAGEWREIGDFWHLIIPRHRDRAKQAEADVARLRDILDLYEHECGDCINPDCTHDKRFRETLAATDPERGDRAPWVCAPCASGDHATHDGTLRDGTTPQPPDAHLDLYDCKTVSRDAKEQCLCRATWPERA